MMDREDLTLAQRIRVAAALPAGLAEIDMSVEDARRIVRALEADVVVQRQIGALREATDTAVKVFVADYDRALASRDRTLALQRWVIMGLCLSVWILVLGDMV